VPFLLFELFPHPHQSLQMWLYLVSTLATVLASVDLVLLMRRLYVNRGDLAPLQWPLLLIGAFAVLMCVSRMLRFAAFFLVTLYVSETIITLLSSGVLLISVLAARSAESYLLRLPKLADLKAANDEARDATALLRLRESMAMEAMVISADNTILEANSWAYRVLEYDQSKHELLGMRSHQLIHEDDHRTVYQNIQRNYREPYIVRALTKTGGIKHIQVIGSDFVRTSTASPTPDRVRVTNFRDVTVERLYLREQFVE
jgi:PAS domain-containing protein